MWFGFREDNTWYPINVARVNEILSLNREGKKPASLNEDRAIEKESISSLNSDLESLDKKFKGKQGGGNKRRKKGGRPDNRNRGNRPPNPQTPPSNPKNPSNPNRPNRPNRPRPQ